MNISTDATILGQWGFVTLNATILYTWLVMGLLALVSWLATRRLTERAPSNSWQNAMEAIIDALRQQIGQTCYEDARRYLPFISTLFLFIAVANLLSIVPGYHPPTASLSTTAALAFCVFIAVHLYGILRQGIANYLKHYITPSVFMLPFHVMGELSRTVALAVRLYGNIMAGTMVLAILLVITPYVLPVAMQALELLIGLIQAYIFATLATVYIASAIRAHDEVTRKTEPPMKGEQSI